MIGIAAHVRQKPAEVTVDPEPAAPEERSEPVLEAPPAPQEPARTNLVAVARRTPS
jgi:hypothetical protein